MTLTPGSEPEHVVAEVIHVERDGYRGARKAGMRFDALRKEQYVGAIRRGLRRSTAAELVGVRAQTVWHHMRDDDDFCEAVESAEQARIDEVESALFETAIRGNVTAQQVVLYNRRSDEWADMRQLHARLEAAKVAEAQTDVDAEITAKEALADKLNKLRAQVLANVMVEPDDDD